MIYTMSKRIEKMLNENLKIDTRTEYIDRYILHCNKHLRSEVLSNKLEQLTEYLTKHYDAKIEVIGDEYIVKDQKCIKLKIRLQGENKTILTLLNHLHDEQ